MANNEQSGVLTQDELVQLLGRPLTTTEVSGLSSYLEIVSELMADLLCSDLSCGNTAVRKFNSRDGYKSLPIGIVSSVNSVTVDSETVDQADYSLMQNDRYEGGWFNILVFNDPMCAGKVYSVDADWGFDDCMPSDLKLLFARAFAMVSKGHNTDSRLQSKRIEDTAFTYRDVSLDQQFTNDNSRTIRKYSTCGWSEVRSGRVHSIPNSQL